jgi:hypothetical protein
MHCYVWGRFLRCGPLQLLFEGGAVGEIGKKSLHVVVRAQLMAHPAAVLLASRQSTKLADMLSDALMRPALNGARCAGTTTVACALACPLQSRCWC